MNCARCCGERPFLADRLAALKPSMMIGSSASVRAHRWQQIRLADAARQQWA
jgi:hypothetical protein